MKIGWKNLQNISLVFHRLWVLLKTYKMAHQACGKAWKHLWACLLTSTDNRLTYPYQVISCRYDCAIYQHVYGRTLKRESCFLPYTVLRNRGLFGHTQAFYQVNNQLCFSCFKELVSMAFLRFSPISLFFHRVNKGNINIEKCLLFQCISFSWFVIEFQATLFFS